MQGIVYLAAADGIELKKVATTNGGEYAGPCPGCGGRDRFRVWPNQDPPGGRYWCRQCDMKGDAIQYLRDFRNMSFKQACAELEIEMSTRSTSSPRSSALRPPAKKQSGSTNQRKPAPAANIDQTLWQTKAIKFLIEANHKLKDNPPVLTWLASRGIDENTIDEYCFGWNDETKFRPREAWGLPTEIKGGKKKRLWLPRGVVIPAYDINKNVRRLRIRRPKKDIEGKFKQKYVVVPGSEMGFLLLGDYMARAFVVVESELDAYAVCAAAGDMVGVIAVGSATGKPSPPMIDLLSDRTILVALDYDDAGRKAWLWWKRKFRRARRWPARRGKDPGEQIASGNDIRKWVFAGLPKGLRIGRSPVEVQEKRGGAISDPDAPADPRPDALPAQVRELVTILKKFPFQIVHTETRTAIWKPKGYVNDQVEGKLSNLIYFDDMVRLYLTYHPDKLIDGRNIIYHG